MNKSTAPLNVLFIFTDQQSATMMSCAGNGFVKTPAMDRLAARGTRFEHAYCAAPVCSPSRLSLFTGCMPSDFGMRSNEAGQTTIPEKTKSQGIGWQLKSAGYQALYGGKQHLPHMTAKDLGFDMLSMSERDELAGACESFLAKPGDQPFFLVASFINPHDICYMAIRDSSETDQEQALVNNAKQEFAELDRSLKLPPGMSEKAFFDTVCPPLPDNFEPQQDEPEAIRDLLALRLFRMKARQNWSDQRWRLHRWAYARLTERVDEQIGRVLDALDQSPVADRTVVIFTSDHGDMDASHRMEHKTAFYEEAARVPLIVAGPNVPAGVINREHVVSNGLDLIPAVCDYANITPDEALAGQSFRPLAEGRAPATPRDTVPMVNEIGYAVVSKTHKYALHDRGANREQLYDLIKDPGETRNAINDADQAETLATMREAFAQWWSGVENGVTTST